MMPAMARRWWPALCAFARRWWPASRAVLITLCIVLGMVDSCMLPGAGPAKKLVFTPVQPIIDATRIAQKWGLFDGASREQFRMHIEIQYAAGKPWEPLFIASDDAHQDYADELAYRRVRGAWNPRKKKPTGAYDKFATWILTRALADHPDAVAARVVMDRLRINEHGGANVVEEGLFPKIRRQRQPGAVQPPAPHPAPPPPSAPTDEEVE